MDIEDILCYKSKSIVTLVNLLNDVDVNEKQIQLSNQMKRLATESHWFI